MLYTPDLALSLNFQPAITDLRGTSEALPSFAKFSVPSKRKHA